LKEKKMTKKKQTIIRPEILDELLQGCSALPTQEDLFGPEGVIKKPEQGAD
jgi:hypothetical protein